MIDLEIPSKGSWEHKVTDMEFVLPYIVLKCAYLKHKACLNVRDFFTSFAICWSSRQKGNADGDLSLTCGPYHTIPECSIRIQACKVQVVVYPAFLELSEFTCYG
ncbi:hypothetical protein GUJ93_ZPchr0011g27644 [Zizania palustris]|uniref:Uncharacterized protein n=1 Tax=Zizania palustris TaxID=103762 RepID=A0A8J5WKI4_ZIZPA|nr:hypothetical protein GUJ93_ZPchr0011g27644 [Zizania palustris]